MKKLRKIFTLLLIFTFVLFSFKLGRVLAETETFILDEISISDKSEDVLGEVVKKNNKEVDTDITFHKLDDYVTYKLVIKNNEDKKYILKSISDDNTNKYITYEYEKELNKTIDSKSTIEFNINAVYSKEIDDISLRGQQDKVIFTLVLEDEDGNIVNKDIIVNPNTGDNIIIYIIGASLSLLGIVILSFKLKNNTKKALLVLTLITPIVVDAATNKSTITFNNNYKIYDRFKVTYNVDDDSSEEIVKYKEKANKPNNPEKDGYTFDEWYLDEDKYDFNTEVVEDIVLTGKYTINNYKIIYELNDGQLEDGNSNPTSYTIDDEITLNNPTREGYTFIGWTGSNGDTPEENVTINKGSTGNLSYEANYKINTYTVSFETSGGSSIQNQIVEHGSKATKPDDPEKEGHTFIKWYTDNTFTTEYSFDTLITEDIVVYAKYEINKYTVSFETYGGTEVEAQTVEYGSKVTKPTNPKRVGNEFGDWYTTDSFDKIFDFNTPIKEDTIIHAKFINKCNTFATDSWSTIAKNIYNNKRYYALEYDCRKEVEMDLDDDGVNESYTVRLANTTKPDICDNDGFSKTSCGTVIEFVDVVFKYDMYRYTGSQTTYGGWKERALAIYLNDVFYNKLPNDLKSLIISTYPIVSGSGVGGVSEDIKFTDTNLNKIYLLSTREVGYTATFDNKSDQLRNTRTLDFYNYNTSAESKIKYDLSGTAVDWWLRTASYGDNLCYYGVSPYAKLKVYSSNYENGVAPAFRITKK